MAAFAPAASKASAALRTLCLHSRANLHSAPRSLSLFRPMTLPSLNAGWSRTQTRGKTAHAQYQENPQEETVTTEQGREQGTLQATSQNQGGMQSQIEKRGKGGAMERWGTQPMAPALADIFGPWVARDRSLRSMLNAVDRMFDDMMIPAFPAGAMSPFHVSPRQLLGGGSGAAVAVRPLWEATEDETAYHLRFDLPGMSKEEVSVKVTDDNMLHVSAAHNAEESEEAEGGRVRSRVSREFRTSVQLPEAIQREGVKGEVKDGMLSVTVPKVEPQAPHERVFDVPVV